MKKRILFVDDEPLVVTGLRRTLRSLREEWDMEFVDSGAKALLLMEQAPFDVVVTDMHMPGMDGAELLREVMIRFPGTVRIILSGHSEKDLILKCINSTHRFLSKPCESDSLIVTIQRACNLQQVMENKCLKQLLAKMERLPSLPSIYVQIVEELNDPFTTIERIGAIVSQDLAMTAQILKLVNSAFFGPSRVISSPTEATQYLGIDTIESLVLSIHTFAQFKDIKGCGFDIDALMNHSLRVAARAKQIAQLEGVAAKMSDACFVAGMLHDTGKLVLAANFPNEYRDLILRVRREGLSICATEAETFGADHAGMGSYLLGLWGLPVEVVEAIAHHHIPQQTSETHFNALTAVHAADALDYEKNEAVDSAAFHKIDGKYLEGLGMLNRVDVWRDPDSINRSN